MTWQCDLRVEVLRIFAEAQLPRMPQVLRWMQRRSERTNERRREIYDAHRYLNDEWYRGTLERNRVKSLNWRRENPDKYQAIERSKREAADRRRAKKVSGRRCKECGGPIEIRSRFGRVPEFCSKRCTHRKASRDWWRRKKGQAARPAPPPGEKS